jgi:hypothetical protein
LDVEDLVAGERGGGQGGDRLVEDLTDEGVLARAVRVTYEDRATDYQPAVQQDRRIAAAVGGAVSAGVGANALDVELPMVITAGQARAAAEAGLYEIWVAERYGYRFTAPPSALRLLPTDVVTLTRTSEGVTATFTARVVEAQVGADFTVTCRAVAQHAPVYSVTTEGAASHFLAPGGIAFPAATRAFFLDLPVVSYPLDDNEGFWAGLAPALYAPALDWAGAVLFRSADPDGGFEPYLATATPTVWVKAVTALPDQPRWTVWDDTSTVDVIVQSDDELESRTDLEVLGGANALALGAELIRFATASLIAARTYRLSRLLRGRAGTESFTGSHAIGEVGVLVEPAKWIRAGGPADTGNARHYKPVTAGTEVEAVDAVAFTSAGLARKPRAVSHVTGSRDGSDNLTIDFVRRTRHSGEWKSGAGSGTVPLNEDAEAYEIDVLDQASPQTVVRTIAVSAPTASYTAAQQTADGLTPGDPVEVDVYQVSAQVGRGYVKNATI